MSHKKAKRERHPPNYSEVTELFRTIREKNRWYEEMMEECRKMVERKYRQSQESE